MKKLFRIFILCVAVVGLLSLGGYSVSRFLTEIETKDAYTIFEPLINKFGIHPIETPEIPTVSPDTTDNKVGEEKPKEEEPKQTENQEKDEKQDSEKKTVSKEDILDLVSQIRVSTYTNDDYNRDDWEKPAKQFIYNGKKVSRVKYDAYTSQYLISETPFKYKCPYSGKEIDDIKLLDFDHLLPLSYISKYSNVNWSKEQKNKFAQDENVGVSVLNKENRSKGAKSPSEWLPKENQGDYCYSWLLIAKEYGLALRQQDIDTCKLVCLNEIASGKELKRMN